jgi:hypothetical protein
MNLTAESALMYNRPMSEVSFEDQGDTSGRLPKFLETFDLGALLIKWRIASTRQQAQYILIGMILVAIVLTFFVYHLATPSSTVPTPAQTEQIQQHLPDGSLPHSQ